MATLPVPKVEEWQGYQVVRDDLIPGGTKRRVIDALLRDGEEFVYAGPACGYAQVALAYACRDLGKRATLFLAQSKKPHRRTAEALKAGAKAVMVPNGYLSVVKARAREYCQASGATLLPFGLDAPAVLDGLTAVARALPVRPQEVWTVAGSGTLTRALQQAWPGARFYAVVVGGSPDVGAAHPYFAPEPFERDAKDPPPFPSCSNYDAKAWRLIKLLARQGGVVLERGGLTSYP